VSRAQRVANVARTHGSELRGFAESIASLYGVPVTPINFKSLESIERKAKDLGSYEAIRDTVRTTIVSDRESLDSITKELRRRMNEVDIQDYQSTGYTGVIAKYRFADGTWGEIQANTPRMIYAKEKPDVARSIIGDERYASIARETGLEGGRGHELYEQLRVLDPQSSERKALEAKSREYYSHFKG